MLSGTLRVVSLAPITAFVVAGLHPEPRKESECIVPQNAIQLVWFAGIIILQVLSIPLRGHSADSWCLESNQYMGHQAVGGSKRYQDSRFQRGYGQLAQRRLSQQGSSDAN